MSVQQSHDFLSVTEAACTKTLRQQYINNEVQLVSNRNRLPSCSHALFIVLLYTPGQRECINVEALIVASENSVGAAMKGQLMHLKKDSAERESNLVIIHVKKKKKKPTLCVEAKAKARDGS